MEDAREVNIPLLRKAVEWAEAEAAKPPELCEWNQAWWVVPDATKLGRAPSCGTCYCIAGYVAQTVEPGFAEHDYVGNQHVSQVAANAIGITLTEAVAEGGLFLASNTIEDVRRIAEEIAQERL